MQKQQHIARRLISRRILLPSPPARRLDHPTRKFPGNLNRPIAASTVSDQHLMRSQRICPFDGEGDISFLIQCRDDDGQSH